jgi:O-antigen/teichoic acid export membrane protein
MSSPHDDWSNFQDTGGKRKIHYVRLIPLSEGSKQQQDMVARGDDVSRHADFTISAAPNLCVDEINTQVDLLAVGKSALFPDFSSLERSPFNTQQTRSFPAIQASNGDIKLEAQGSGEGGYASLIRNLVKSSGIYATTSLVSPLISLVLAPFLTRNLSYAAYGALAVLNTAITLLTALTQLGLNAAFFRSYNYDYESQKDRQDVLSTVVVLISITSLCTAMTIILTAPWLSTLLFDNISMSDAVRAAALVLLFQNLAVPGFAWLRAENRALFFALLSIANLVISLGLNIVLVGMLHMGIAGSLIASAIGYAFAGTCTLPVILLRAGLHLRFDIARGLLSFGLPMIFSIVSVWVLQLSDRFLLSRLGSLTQTASYSVAYNLGSAMSVVVLSPFTLAWPSALFTIARKDDAQNIFKLVFRWFSLALLFAAFAFTLLSTVALYLFFPAAYHSAASIIPIIVISIVFYGIYNIFTTGISIQRKTWFAAVFTALSALANVAFNLVLIPLYGSMGAAISTLLAYMLLAFIAYVVNQRLYPIPYEIGIFVIELLVGIAFFFGSSMVAPGRGTYLSWGISLVALALYGGCLLLTCRWLSNSHKNV